MGSASKHTYVLILAGGGGTRLWPISRDDTPKQFLKLFSGKSLYEMALERALKITDAKKIFVATSAKYTQKVRSLSRDIPPENIISEPVRRDSALPRGIACQYIIAEDPEAVVINVVCDHLISPVGKFVSKMKLAAEIAYVSHEAVVVGVQPTFPHTGMGHIKASKQHPKYQNPDVMQGEIFIEKPPLDLAKKYTESGEYFWNANYFVWRADVYLNLLKKYAPSTYAFLPQLGEARGTTKESEVFHRSFQMAPTLTVEYAVVEKLKNFPLIRGDFSFTDVGDWKEVWNNLPQDESGNVIQGDVKSQYINIDSENNLLFLNKKLIATVGLHNMVIIDTPDALLICPRDSSQSVKKIVELLKTKEMKEYL